MNVHHFGMTMVADSEDEPHMDLEAFLPFRLNRAAAEISRLFSKVYAERFGIDVPEWRVMATLGRTEPVTAQAVVDSTRTHKSTISRAVSSLIERGWIERVISEDDRRSQLIRFTSEGREVFADIVPRMLAFEEELLGRLGARGRNALERGVAELERILLEDTV